MGIASDLRQSVLQAAMQGKLTTQKAEDGDARDLLLAIREEKEKLVKEKKGKKEKPLAPIAEDEVPFDIPENWVWCRLGDIVLFLTDGTHKTPHYAANGVPFLSVKDLSEGFVNFGNTKFISPAEHKELTKRCNPQKGNILLTKVGTTGIPVVIDTEQEFSIFVSVALLKLPSCISPIFLKYIILSPEVQKQCKEHTRGVGNKNWVLNDIRNTIIPLPPLPEQQRIVARIEALMKEIDKLEQTEKELEAIKAAFPADMKASLLQAVMEGKLTERKAEDGDAKDLLLAIRAEKEKLVKEKKIKKGKPLAPIAEDEIPFDIPENWVWCRLNDITVKEIRRGKSPKYSDVRSNTLSFAQKCNTKYDGIQMSLARYLDESTLKRYTEEDAVIDGDTIINSTGHGTLGRVGFFTDSNNPNHLTIYPDSHVTIVRPSKNCDSRFIHLYIKTQQSWFETKGEGSTNQTELKPAVIKSIVIPLPPLPEQRRIVEKLEQLLPLCDSLSKH